ncbi:hypothetical protein E3N88_41648 [Mikania micrantha]|uniref:CCHC-type domain-containing protein n=1 Tax=Mikania micrantha TaxID=192012 RepID=A0A5N6LMB1_9ASTR|nr:hypothetical protein E3N88_41648 [Mikania micrantha]
MKLPPPLDTDFTVEQKKVHDQWERYNRMSLMVINNSISPTIRGAIPNSENAKVYLDLVEEQFKGTSKLMLKKGSFKNKGRQGDKSKPNKFSTLGASTSTFKGTPKCRLCHKKWHIQRDCPKFKEWLAKNGIPYNKKAGKKPTNG